MALFGQEFSTISSGNHMNVFEVRRVIDVPNGRFDLFLDSFLAANPDSTNQPAIVQLNHPADYDDESSEYGADDYSTKARWLSSLSKHARLIEVLNGPGTKDVTGERARVMEADYLWYLNTGLRLAPSGDQDNHYRTWGTLTDARTAVISDALTKPKLLDAIRKRHVYATEDKNLRVIFTVNGRLTGDVIQPPAANSELKIEFTLQDDDEPDARYEIAVFSDKPGGAVAKVSELVDWTGNTSPGSVGTIEDIHYEGPGHYLMFRLSQLSEDGPPDRAWTAPVWFDSAPERFVAPTREPSIVIASRRSKLYHISAQCRDAKNISAANRLTGPDAKKGRRKHSICPRK